MPLEIQGDLDCIEQILIDGDRLDSDDGDVWYLPKRLCGSLMTDELPENVAFLLCVSAEDNVIQLAGCRKTTVGRVERLI